MAHIALLGAGYVGLVTAAGLARLGHHVVVVDIDRDRLARIAAGRLPIHEPGLDALVFEEVAHGRLRFTDDVADAVPGAEHVFLAVHTPPKPDGEADTTFVFAAVRSILPHIRTRTTIVTKSTVPVGTGDRIEVLVVAEHAPVDVVSNPEFLREGSAVHDFQHPDRIVVGAPDHAAAERVAALYEALDAPVILTGRRSAELAKYAANAFLATRISFMNEMAAISEAVGADIGEIEKVVGTDARIGPAFLKAGLGWGGSCFPKDLSALVGTAAGAGHDARIVSAVIDVNHGQRQRAFELLADAVGEVADPVVAVLGLAFKPDTDDLRGSPALDVMRRLLDAGITVNAHDPAALEAAATLLPGPVYHEDLMAAITGADALLVATDWPVYRELDWPLVRTLMRGDRIVDGRNMLHGADLVRLGFDYRGFGRLVAGRAAPSRPRAVPVSAPAVPSERLVLTPTRATADARLAS